MEMTGVYLLKPFLFPVLNPVLYSPPTLFSILSAFNN